MDELQSIHWNTAGYHPHPDGTANVNSPIFVIRNPNPTVSRIESTYIQLITIDDTSFTEFRYKLNVVHELDDVIKRLDRFESEGMLMYRDERDNNTFI